MVIRGWAWRAGPVLAAWLVSAFCFAQSLPPPMPEPNARQIMPKLSGNVRPVPGHGELLALQADDNSTQVVKLQCKVGPFSLVMLPTGELKVVDEEKTKPTTEPFVAATSDEIGESLKKVGFADYKIEHGTYYTYVYKCSDAFFMHAKSILESMMPGVVGSLKTFGLKIERPVVPMVVIIMPSRQASDAFFPMPPEVIAYYNSMTNQVVMYEDQDMWGAAPEYAAKQAGYVIAHEGVHQLLANIGVQNRMSNWPPWICEGLAEYYCPLKVNSSIVRKGNTELPTRTMRWTKAGMVNDLRMYHLLKMPAASGEVLTSLLEAEAINSAGYALAWGLVHYLASEKPAEFRKYMADISKYEPLDPKNRVLAGRPDPLFVKHFGSNFAGLEQEIQEHLTSKEVQVDYVDPIVNQTHYVVRSVEKKGRTFEVQLVITTSPEAAKKWKDEQSAANKKAKFFTKICKTRAEAEWQVQKLQQQ